MSQVMRTERAELSFQPHQQQQRQGNATPEMIREWENLKWENRKKPEEREDCKREGQDQDKQQKQSQQA